MSAQARFAVVLAQVAFGIVSAALAGCSSAAVPAQTPASRATAFGPSRCAGFADDGPVADILSGKSVESVGPLYMGANSKTSSPRLEGAVLSVRPAPGVTSEWLNRALECHSARLVTGHASAVVAESDPFVLAGGMPYILVRSEGDGFRVEISAASSADAREILGRVEAFGASSNIVANQQIQ
jgi:hypothetical protein